MSIKESFIPSCEAKKAIKRSLILVFEFVYVQAFLFGLSTWIRTI